MLSYMNELTDLYWRAVERRDPHLDGVFVYAVRTTGVFCRPGCPSRRPLRANVEFFASSAHAAQAGFRPCQRCHPDQGREADPAITTVVAVCRWLEAEDDGRNVDDLARQFGWSERHLRRLFQRVMTVSIGSYRRAVRHAAVRTTLRAEMDVTDAFYEAGYGSARAFYEDGARRLGMSVRSYRSGGRGQSLRYTVFPTAVGRVLAASTPHGIAAVYIGVQDEALVAQLQREFPAAHLERDDEGLAEAHHLIAAATRGEGDASHLPVDLAGTAFQARVWEALRQIPPGETRSYAEVAAAMGMPSAARAVAGACARNPAAIVVPCHRVIRRDGRLAGYRWGTNKKGILLEAEAKAPRP